MLRETALMLLHVCPTTYCRAEQQELRTTCLHGWLLLAKHTAAAARRVEALQRRWAHRLLMAWLQHSTAAQALALQAVLRADRWHNRRSLHMCYSSWKQGCHIKQQLVQGYTGQRQAVLLSRAMQVNPPQAHKTECPPCIPSLQC